MEESQPGTVVRALPMPGEPQRAAAWLVRIAAALATTDAWFWLDGASVSTTGEARDASARTMSYLGYSSDVRHAIHGSEREFLADLRPHNVVHVRAEPGQRGLSSTTSHAAPAGFRSGWVVALGYELGVALLGADPAPDPAPPAFALRTEVVLAIDHAAQVAELRAENDDQIDRWLEKYASNLQEPEVEHLEHVGPAGGPQKPQLSSTTDDAPASGRFADWRHSDAKYLDLIASSQQSIRDGEAYVLCLTDTATVSYQTATPLELFLRLRDRGGATRAGVLVAGERALVSASPEEFISIAQTEDGAKTVATRPIKGTRPRGETPARDAALAAELQNDPKERAENLMIVDLMRNDLSQVCDPASVRVTHFLQVETHPHVHQLVSTISGRLRDGADAVNVIEHLLPGGSMTGAPKRRAVDTLKRLEGGPRGLYSGCFGWIDDQGEAELAMAIRAIELRGSQHAMVGAGGGITSDSVPHRELGEKKLKAAALLAALDASSHQP